MKNVLIIADVAGEMDALLRLVALVPPDTIKVSVGDMCDRGKRSKEVFEYFMDGYGVDKFALLGNHEHMMLEHYRRSGARYYERGTWHWNGGGATLDSYPNKKVPDDVLNWVGSLPVFMEFGDQPKLFVSHAPSMWELEFVRTHKTRDVFEMIWNRFEPIYDPGYFQVFGHNSHWGLREFRREGVGTPYALCIDQSRTKRALTGYLYPEGRVIEVPYDDEEKILAVPYPTPDGDGDDD